MKDLSEVRKIIGWEITQDLKTGTLKIDQKRYIQDLLESEGLTSYHATILPVKVGSTLFLEQVSDHQQANLTEYQYLIGKLMYLNYRTRSDITFMVGQLSYHNSDFYIRHLHIAKQVFRYLKGIITLGIKWENNLIGHKVGEKYGVMGMVGYADSSYTGNIEDRKLIIGYCFFFNRSVITWYSK